MSVHCEDCDSPLAAETDAEHYRRTAQYRYNIVCPAGCSSRPADQADPIDLEVIDNAAERYWTRRWSA